MKLISKKEIIAKRLGVSDTDRVQINLFSGEEIEEIPQYIKNIEPARIIIGKMYISIIVARTVERRAYIETTIVEEENESNEIKKLTEGLWLIKRKGI